MRVEQSFRNIEGDDFTRRFSLRAGNLMWLLGAGASASSGIPTAWEMIWEFKQRLYVSQRHVSPKSVSDLSNPAVRDQLQAYIDGSENFPSLDAPDEYAALFEAAWSNEGDRRSYIDGKISGAKPSYGHLALATLMRAGLTKLVWTTNFDSLVADACAKVFDGTGALTTVALDAPTQAQEMMSAKRWPIEIKLHGDFRSRRLKNTNDELRLQDAQLRRVFIDSCQANGLVVAGYSGRDESIMDALSEALEQANPFPGGLFWLHRRGGTPLPRVSELLTLAAQKGVDGGLVEVENFDETLRDLLRLIDNLDTTVLDGLASERPRWTAAARPAGNRGWPVVRLNAIPVLTSPTVCRRVVCDIGGYAEVRAAVETAGVNILTTRTRKGILAFGSDPDVRAAFGSFGISEFDLHSIDSKRLRFDSAERGLLRDAISRALAREHAMALTRHRVTDLLVPMRADDESWAPLKKLVGPLAGSVKGQADLSWREGVGLRLDWADDRLWLLIEPRTVFDGVTTENRHAATDFARERTVKRYNRQLNDLIAFWSELLAKNGAELRALEVGNGIDAAFQLSSVNAFSRRIRA